MRWLSLVLAGSGPVASMASGVVAWLAAPCAPPSRQAKQNALGLTDEILNPAGMRSRWWERAIA